jgi:hypothetical protein
MTTITEEAFNQQQLKLKPGNGTTNKKPATTKAKKGADAEALGAATGETLAALAKQAGKVEGVAELATLAAQLAKGTITQGALVKLRDTINAVSAALREAKKTALARQFSTANRAVRRLERAGRKPVKK